MLHRPLVPSPTSSNREQLMLEAIRRHVHLTGLSPSYRNLAAAVDMKPQHVGKTLDQLEQHGLITRRRGQARSIQLVRRAANLSDTELEMEARVRGYTIKRDELSPVLVSAFSAPVTEYGMAMPPEMIDLLGALDGEEARGEGNEAQGRTAEARSDP